MSVQQIASACNRTMEHQAINALIGYSTAWNDATMTDSIAGALYSYDNRRNYVNGSADEFEKIKDLANLMLTQQDMLDDDGTRAPLILYPGVMACNIMNKGKIIAQVSHNNVKKLIELKLDVKDNANIKKPVSKNHINLAPVA